MRVRFDKPGTIQRNATAYVSSTDRAEAELVGREAVRLAADGQIRRDGDARASARR